MAPVSESQPPEEAAAAAAAATASLSGTADTTQTRPGLPSL